MRQQIVGTSPTAMATKFINVLFSTSKKADDTEKLTGGDEETGDASSGVTMTEPPGSSILYIPLMHAALESWCEKKGNKKFGVAGGGWQARYLKICKPGQLLYFKDANTNQVRILEYIRYSVVTPTGPKRSGGFACCDGI